MAQCLFLKSKTTSSNKQVFWSTICLSNASRCVNLSKWPILVVDTQDFGSMLLVENKKIWSTICLSNASQCVNLSSRRDPRFWLDAYFWKSKHPWVINKIFRSILCPSYASRCVKFVNLAPCLFLKIKTTSRIIHKKHWALCACQIHQNASNLSK